MKQLKDPDNIYFSINFSIWHWLAIKTSNFRVLLKQCMSPTRTLNCWGFFCAKRVSIIFGERFLWRTNLMSEIRVVWKYFLYHNSISLNKTQISSVVSYYNDTQQVLNKFIKPKQKKSGRNWVLPVGG